MEIPGPEIGEVIILKHFDLSRYDTFLPSRSLLLKVLEFFPNSAKLWGPSVQTHVTLWRVFHIHPNLLTFNYRLARNFHSECYRVNRVLVL